LILLSPGAIGKKNAGSSLRTSEAGILFGLEPHLLYTEGAQ
jgi:hypothetical protein